MPPAAPRVPSSFDQQCFDVTSPFVLPLLAPQSKKLEACQSPGIPMAFVTVAIAYGNNRLR